MLAERVKQAAGPDVQALAEEAGFRPSRGKKFHCALHEDRTPSAHPYAYSVHCFSCGEDFDAIDLARLIVGGSAGDAIRWLAARYGVVPEAGRQRAPQFSELEYAHAELFRAGLCWALERELAMLKRPLLETGFIEGEQIFKLTALLAQAQKWRPWQATVFLRTLRSRDPHRVQRWIRDALDFQLAFACVIAHAGAQRATVA